MCIITIVCWSLAAAVLYLVTWVMPAHAQKVSIPEYGLKLSQGYDTDDVPTQTLVETLTKNLPIVLPLTKCYATADGDKVDDPTILELRIVSMPHGNSSTVIMTVIEHVRGQKLPIYLGTLTTDLTKEQATSIDVVEAVANAVQASHDAFEGSI